MGRKSGELTGLVVAATDTRIVAAAPHLVRRAIGVVSIPYQRITDFHAQDHSLVVRSDDAVISLAKCAPDHVAALAAELRMHASDAADAQ
jgi:hypothetical protein